MKKAKRNDLFGENSFFFSEYAAAPAHRIGQKADGGTAMIEQTIYETIAKRTNGDIYIGVVGPVRTGKSTFIRRFLDTAVLPHIENEFDRRRTQDEIPQSGSGKAVMTTEPKFIPDESVSIRIGNTDCRVKMIDCVGYMVAGATGGEDEGGERMVMTPWSDTAMTFSEAADIGTAKVIGEHATIAVLVTTDGTFTDIPRENYVEPEERVARELKESGKPFVILLNSARPQAEESRILAEELEEKYGAPVALVSCPEMEADDMNEILSMVIGEFPVRELLFKLPDWVDVLPEEHPLRRELVGKIGDFADRIGKLGDVPRALGATEGVAQVSLDAGAGCGSFVLPLSREKMYETVNGVTGLAVTDDVSLVRTLLDFARIKQEYEAVAGALHDVREKGYGIVMPKAGDIELSEPTLVKQAGGYGVKVSARAETIHMIRTGIRTEFCPVVGSEAQSEEVLRHLTEEYEEDPARVLRCDLFGKTLYDLVSDGMVSKLSHMPDESREKLGETLEKIIDEGSNGLICILL